MTDPDNDSTALIAALFLLAGIIVGSTVATALVSPNEPQPDQPWVGCHTGDGPAVCFTYGDVEFEWLNQTTSTNGTITLTNLPINNSTVRRPA